MWRESCCRERESVCCQPVISVSKAHTLIDAQIRRRRRRRRKKSGETIDRWSSSNIAVPPPPNHVYTLLSLLVSTSVQMYFDYVPEMLCAQIGPDLRSSQLLALPVMGLPGWCPENTRRDFYFDPKVFRPRRPPEAEVEAPGGLGQGPG